jgi:MFS family permease
MYVLGGFFGCIIFGCKADIHGRKKLIKITLFITNVGLVFCIFFCYFLDGKSNYYRKQFNKNYSYKSENEIPYKDILEDIYVQKLIRKLINKIFIIYLVSIFITNLGASPLLKICLALLLENSTNEEIVLTNFRTYSFFVRGCSPLLASIFIVNFNNITLSYTILFLISFILFISSFFVVNESMRYYYELCEWKNLSNFIMNTFVLEDSNDIQLLEPRELRELQREENIIINKEYEIRRLNLKAEHDEDNIFEINNYSNYLKRKISSINRKIKRKADIVLKLVEVKYNPLIIHICIKSNKMYYKSKFIVLSALLLLYLFLYFLCYEMIQKPFFREKDLYLERGFNFIFNSNFLGLFFSTLISNYFYYYLYRIYCFRTVIIISSLCISFLSIIYHLVCLDSENTPLYYNQYNFSMMDIYYKDKKRGDKLSFIYIMYFAINGICIYIDLILIKMSKTIYRCTVMTDQTVSLLISLLLTRAFSVEINRPFLLLGFINFIFLFIILFLDEMTETPNIVNDLKQNVEKKVKHFKSE